MKRTLLQVSVTLLLAPATRAQNGAVKEEFEAASVKVADHHIIAGTSFKAKGGPGTSDPGRITFTQLRLMDLLMRAWELPDYRILGPDWISGLSDFFTITATMPPDTTKQQFQGMLQQLLIDRFKIRFHHEIRSFPGYDLVLAPGGPKLARSKDPDAPDPPRGAQGKTDSDGFLVLPPGHGEGLSLAKGDARANFQNFTIYQFAGDYLRFWVQKATGTAVSHIEDKTGLTGKYDFRLRFDPAQAVSELLVGPRVTAQKLSDDASQPGTPRDPSGSPELFKALEQQLGLKLVKNAKGYKLDIIVIDRLERTPIE